MTQKTVTFLALGKNVGKSIDGILLQIEDLGSLFKSFQVLYIDGESTDDTKHIFETRSTTLSASNIVFKSAPSLNLIESEGSFI